MDTVTTGALLVLACAVIATAAAVIALRLGARPQGDDVATEIGLGPATITGARTDAEPAGVRQPLLVPMRREAGREADVKRFVREIEDAQTAAEAALTDEQARLIEAVRRVHARRRREQRNG